MPRHHESFVVRRWQLETDEQRIEIEHVQSGQRQLVHSVDEAVARIRGFDRRNHPEHLLTFPTSGKKEESR
jgi:hypothetical protein